MNQERQMIREVTRGNMAGVLREAEKAEGGVTRNTVSSYPKHEY